VNRYQILAALSLILLATGATATTYRVDASGAGDFSAIAPAVAFADSGDVIMVAPGTYTGPDNRDISFMGKDLSLMSEAGPQFTIIDLERQGRGFVFWSGETDYSIVDGFTVKRGRTDMGGAIYVAGSNPIIRDCIFEDNYANEFGGAIYLGIASEAEVDECRFQDNYAEHYGGGIYCLQSKPRIRWCTFENNRADLNGGAISCKEGTWASISSCDFRENTSGEFGGAVYCGMTGSPSERISGGSPSRISGTAVYNSFFYENESDRGGAVYINAFSEVSVDHCLFVRNRGAVAGGGLYAETSYEYAPVVRSCTFVYNHSPGGAIYSDGGEDWNHMTVSRCIIAFTMPDQTGRAITREPGSWLETIHTITFDNGGSDSVPGIDNLIGVDPRFCDVTTDYYFLCANSPALRGNNEFGKDIGMYLSNCGNCNSPVEQISWGALKALYR